MPANYKLQKVQNKLHWFLKVCRVSAHPCWIQLKDFVSQAGRQTEQCVQMDFRPLWGSGWTGGESVFSYSQSSLTSF